MIHVWCVVQPVDVVHAVGTVGLIITNRAQSVISRIARVVAVAPGVVNCGMSKRSIRVHVGIRLIPTLSTSQPCSQSRNTFLARGGGFGKRRPFWPRC